MWGATTSESGVSLSAAHAAQRATKWEMAAMRGAMIPRCVARLRAFAGDRCCVPPLAVVLRKLEQRLGDGDGRRCR